MLSPIAIQRAISVALLCLLTSASAAAQTAGGAQGAPAAVPLPTNTDGKKVDEFLATLRPPTNLKSLNSGNDLLLEFPAVASAGPVRFRIVSTVPRTDGMWLLSLSPQPDSGAALFTGLTVDSSAFPEATLLLNIEKTQPVLLVVRAGGKYYGLQREIKVGQAMTGSKK